MLSRFFLSFLLVFLLLTSCSICRLSFSSRCCGKLLFLAIDWIISHYVCFLSGLRGKECFLVMWNLKAVIFCSMGWLERKLIVVSVVVGFLHMSTSSLVCLRVIVRSRKAMELCSSYVGLSFMLLRILFTYVLRCASWFLLCRIWLICHLRHIVHRVLCSSYP